MKTKSNRYFMVADAHFAGDAESGAHFTEMLSEVSALPGDCGVVFLGDIFELWIALNRYETEIHKYFLEWSERENRKREIIFAEGNHEFYLSTLRKKYFTECARYDMRRGELLFTHGDRINKADVPYFLLRAGIRNWITQGLLYLTGPAFGPRLSNRVRMQLKSVNMVHKKDFPVEYLERVMEDAGKRGIRGIFIGHFHHECEFEHAGVKLHALPAFQAKGRAAMWNNESQEYFCGPWREVITKLKEQDKI